MLGFVVLLAPLLLRGSWGCVDVPRGWHDICWFDPSGAVCIVSNAFCGREGTLSSLLGGDGRFKPTEATPLAIRLDTRDWSADEDGCGAGDTFASCLALVNNSDSPGGASSATHVIQYAQSSLSYFSIAPWPGARSQIKVSQASVKQAASFGNHVPLCRVFDFVGHHVNLSDATIDVRECLGFYDTPDQYTEDDGVVVSVSESAEGSGFDNIDWIATRGVQNALVVGLRIGNAKTPINVDGLTLSGLSSTGVSTTAAIWNGLGGWSFRAGDCTDEEGCSLWYHAPNVTELTTSDHWQVQNLTAALPVGSAYDPEVNHPSPLETPGACSAMRIIAWIFTGVAGCLFFVAVLVLAYRMGMEQHTTREMLKNEK